MSSRVWLTSTTYAEKLSAALDLSAIADIMSPLRNRDGCK